MGKKQQRAKPIFTKGPPGEQMTFFRAAYQQPNTTKVSTAKIRLETSTVINEDFGGVTE